LTSLIFPLSCIIPEYTHYKTANIEPAKCLVEIHGSLLLSFFRNNQGNSLRSFAACLMRVAFFPCRIEFGKEKTVCSGFTAGSANCCSNHGPYAGKDYGARYCSTSSADCEPRPTVFEEALASPPCHVDTRQAGGLYVHSVEKVMSSVVLRRCGMLEWTHKDMILNSSS